MTATKRRVDVAIHVVGPVEPERCLRCDRIIVSVGGGIVGVALHAAGEGEDLQVECVLSEEVPAGTAVSTTIDCPGEIA